MVPERIGSWKIVFLIAWYVQEPFVQRLACPLDGAADRLIGGELVTARHVQSPRRVSPEPLGNHDRVRRRTPRVERQHHADALHVVAERGPHRKPAGAETSESQAAK